MVKMFGEARWYPDVRHFEEDRYVQVMHQHHEFTAPVPGLRSERTYGQPRFGEEVWDGMMPPLERQRGYISNIRGVAAKVLRGEVAGRYKNQGLTGGPSVPDPWGPEVERQRAARGGGGRSRGPGRGDAGRRDHSRRQR